MIGEANFCYQAVKTVIFHFLKRNAFSNKAQHPPRQICGKNNPEQKLCSMGCTRPIVYLHPFPLRGNGPGPRGLFENASTAQMTGVFLHFLRPLTSHCSQPRSNSDSHPPETSIQNVESAISEAEAQVSPPADTEQEVPFTEVHTQLAPTKQQEKEAEAEEVEVVKEGVEEGKKIEDEEDRGDREEGVSEEYALSSTLRVEEKDDEQQADEEQPDKY